MKVLGALTARCTAAANSTGPVQSWGAMGNWYASAMVAIFLLSEMPPTQAGSNITILTAPLSNRARNDQRVPRVSLAVVGTRVARAKRARASRLSILIGSSNQAG